MKNKEFDFKVLIINPFPIDSDCPIGIMMSNLFSGFSSESILQYYTQNCTIDSNSSFKSRRIDLKPHCLIKITNILKGFTIKKSLRTSVDSDVKLRNTGVRTSNLKIWFEFLFPTIVERKILNEINDFKPTVIYSQIYSYGMLKLITKISDKFSIPVVVHTLDDWMGTNHKRGFISTLPDVYFGKKLRSILNNGKIHMVASPKMKDYMEEFYGGKYRFVMNCGDFTDLRSDLNSNLTEIEPLKIVYTGGLMLERYLVLNEVAKLLESLNTDYTKFELHIYSPISHISNYRKEMNESIFFHNSVEHHNVKRELINSHILIHVESFSANVIRFTKYSLSTKIPEYLTTFKPLIYYGPQDIGVAEFLNNENIGICTDSIQELEKNLKYLYEDKKYSILLGEEGYRKGKILLSNNVMQSMFKDSLQS